MGRKRGLPAKAREKLVAEEFMTAMEVEQKEAVMQAKPDDALFVVDAVGETMVVVFECTCCGSGGLGLDVHYLCIDCLTDAPEPQTIRGLLSRSPELYCSAVLLFVVSA